MVPTGSPLDQGVRQEPAPKGATKESSRLEQASHWANKSFAVSSELPKRVGRGSSPWRSSAGQKLAAPSASRIWGFLGSGTRMTARIFLLGGNGLSSPCHPAESQITHHGLRQPGRDVPRSVSRRGNQPARRKLWNCCEQIFMRKIKSGRRADQREKHSGGAFEEGLSGL
jgi:hypothetical protein